MSRNNVDWLSTILGLCSVEHTKSGSESDDTDKYTQAAAAARVDTNASIAAAGIACAFGTVLLIIATYIITTLQ